MKLLTNKHQEIYENTKICCICKENFKVKFIKNKKCCEVRDHYYYTGEYRDAAHSICNLKYSVLAYYKEIPMVFNNASNFDCIL